MTKEVKDAVLTYLTAQNRPYSVVDIVNNLHRQHGKTAVQKSLDLLVADGSVCEKLNGKQKAYVVNQDTLTAATESELEELDQTISAKEADWRTLEEKVKKAEAVAKALLAELTTRAARKEADAMENEVSAMTKKLKTLSGNEGDQTVQLVTKEELSRSAAKRETAVRAWRTRKRMCQEVIETLLEGYPKSKKALHEEVGIESDQDMGVTIPTM